MPPQSASEQQLDIFSRDWANGFANTTKPAELDPQAQESSRPAKRSSRRITNSSRSLTSISTPTSSNIEGTNSARTLSTALKTVFNPSQSDAARAAFRPEQDSGKFMPKKVHIGVDYGTTFTSVAYFIHPIEDVQPQAFARDVKSIANWPNSGERSFRKQVPTESWYPFVPLGKPTHKKRRVDESDPANEFTQARTILHTFAGEDDLDDDSTAEVDESRSNKFLSGYAVGHEEYSACTTRDPRGIIKYAKLMLLDSSCTQGERNKFKGVLETLISSNMIRRHAKEGKVDQRSAQDVIADFLTDVLRHTESQLREIHGFSDQWKVQYIITVPTIWSPLASRILQSAMEAAIRESGLGTLRKGCIDNLFIALEPEAGATFLMSNDKAMQPKETFMLVGMTFSEQNLPIQHGSGVTYSPDIKRHMTHVLRVHDSWVRAHAGGGTVDVSVYTVDSSLPLRLDCEEVHPAGDNCGASYLNLNYADVLKHRLKDETYLFQNGETLDTIVNRQIPKFEDDYKRRFDVTRRCAHRVYIAGLIGDDQRNDGEERRFQANSLLMNTSDYKIIFIPLLERVVALVAKQFELSFAKGKQVKKVFLVGGFGGAPSLRSYLRNYLERVSNELGYEIELVTDQENSVNAVAGGAVLRALNMENGPSRIAQSSYGFLRGELYDSDFAPHKGADPYFWPVDGELYLDTISYFMKKGQTIPYSHEFKPLPCLHTIEATRKRLICVEILYVSDVAKASHYELTHPKNKGLIQVAGRIEMDMTWLRTEGRIKPINPAPGTTGIKHYRVEYDLVAIVEGRNLRYEARYPSGSGARGEVQKSKQVSIAAAFEPGTK